MDTSFVRRLANIPNGFRAWSIVGGLAELDGATGFCLGASGRIFAYLDPDSCDFPVDLVPSKLYCFTNGFKC